MPNYAKTDVLLRHAITSISMYPPAPYGWFKIAQSIVWDSHTNDWEPIKSHKKALWLLGIFKKLRGKNRFDLSM